MRPGPTLASVIVLLAASQSGAQPGFQASIKRNTSDWNERFRHPMGLGANASLKFLIQVAYGPHENPMLGHSAPLLASQVLGGPDWIDSEGYDIEVKPETWPVWQAVLADRFKLKFHRETRELPVYILSAAASGLRLPPAKQADCVSFLPGTKPRHVPGKVDCGYVSGPFSASTAALNIKGSRVHMADFIRELSQVLDRPILDQTGFTGEFDLDLSFTPGNILPAIEDQLGLKLALSTGPVELVVVDQAERPATN